MQVPSAQLTDARWLHELRMHNYIGSAATLAGVATADGSDARSLNTAKRAACLAKVALLANEKGSFAPMSQKVCILASPLRFVQYCGQSNAKLDLRPSRNMTRSHSSNRA